jgi:hypothetical protein
MAKQIHDAPASGLPYPLIAADDPEAYEAFLECHLFEGALLVAVADVFDDERVVAWLRARNWEQPVLILARMIERDRFVVPPAVVSGPGGTAVIHGGKREYAARAKLAAIEDALLPLARAMLADAELLAQTSPLRWKLAHLANWVDGRRGRANGVAAQVLADRRAAKAKAPVRAEG